MLINVLPIYRYRRVLCIYSIEYRGTHDILGLVFGLDRGGLCQGMAFHVLEKNAESILHNLGEHDMVTADFCLA